MNIYMKEYQLNVDPRILELLGPNLYTNIYYVEKTVKLTPKKRRKLTP